MYDLKRVQDADVKDKKVLLRLDLDVPKLSQLSPVSNNEVIKAYDYTRLEVSIDTINYLIKNKAKIIIVGHMGRPDSDEKELSLESLIPWFITQFGGEKKITEINEFNGWVINESLTILENIRFFKGEEENEEGLSKELASVADLFVNDAFATIHRNHASIVGVTKFLPSYAGFHLQKEVNVLSSVLDKPDRPLTVIVGGAKIETKLPLVEKMHQIADYVLVGGEIAENTKVLLKVSHQKSSRNTFLIVADLSSEDDDITPVSFANFSQAINSSKTIIWNGPMGIISNTFNRVLPSEVGTLEVAKAIANSSAYTIVGGGDTVSFLAKHNLLSKYDFVSTGGGAMLEFLSREKLPGLEALEK